MQKLKALQAVVYGGLLAGALDLAAACLTNYWRGISPIRVFQAIASGLLGTASYQGGAVTAVLGVFFHFIIAFGATIVFYLLSQKFKFFVRQAILFGLLYGIAVYWFMELVVLPLSAFTGKNRFAPDQIASGLIIHALCVGLPIALTVRHFTK
jgi:uncharacterized membrane protein YagU involved in acid resistance